MGRPPSGFKFWNAVHSYLHVIVLEHEQLPWIVRVRQPLPLTIPRIDPAEDSPLCGPELVTFSRCKEERVTVNAEQELSNRAVKLSVQYGCLRPLRGARELPGAG